MTIRTSQERDAIAFAERVLGLLDRGSFVATYKYAVLLGLIDLCLEGTSRSGSPSDMVTTRQLAEKVLELYWSHTLPYPGLPGKQTLRQNSGQPARIISDIVHFKVRLPDPSVTLQQARRMNPDAFQKLLLDIEWTLVKMPLPRLQVVGKEEDRFIYDIAWDRNIEKRKRIVNEYQKTGSGPFDNRILLKPGVGNYLVMLNSLLRPLIQRNWAIMVAQFNKMEESKLEKFLFGSERIPLNPIKPGLRGLQENRCFFCRREMTAGAEVDHFIPWSRYPDNGIENLVLAHESCNRYKSDYLAANEHVLNWAERNREDSQSASFLRDIVQRTQWDTHLAQALGAARAIYLHLPEQAKLWKCKKDFVNPDPQRLYEALGN